MIERSGNDEIFLPPPPETLTRFYGSIEYAMDVLTAHRVALVHVSKMNDPFDPYFEFLNDFEDRYGAILEWIREHHDEGEVRWFKKILPYPDWASAVRGIHRKNAYTRANLFLFCASAPDSDLHPSQNLYMWGHYCLGHRGVAIEFDAESVANCVRAHHLKFHPDQLPETNVWTPVIYAGRVDRLSPGDFYELMKASDGAELETRVARHFNTVSRTKSSVWRLEQEWRVLWHNDEMAPDIYMIPIDEKSIRKVYVGTRVEAPLLKEIALACRANFPSATVLRGRPRPGEFALEFETA